MPTTVDIESQRMRVGTTPVRKIYHGANLIGTRIAELFANGEQGVWFDPSDLSTLFQDAAGTLPVTGVEQPVGLMLDKSGNGNHASQATTTARSILSARYNLLVSTEDCNYGWGQSNVSGSNVTCPDGRPGILVAKTTSTTNAHIRQGLGNAIVGARYSLQVAIYAGSTNSAGVGIGVTTDGNGTWGSTYASVQKISGPGSVTSSSGLCLVTGLSSTVPTVVRVERTYISSVAASVYVYPGTHNSTTEGHSVIVQDCDCRSASGRINIPSYQRVGNITTNPADYDTTGFPYYLKPDGVDDWMVTGNIDLSSTGNMSIVAGANKLNELAPFYQALTELGSGNAEGSFALWHPYSDTQHSRVVARGAGATSQTVIASDVPGNRTDVLTSTIEFGVFRIRYKVSGTQYPNYVGNADPGKFGNLPLYLFSRAGTSSRFRGGFYGLIVVGRLLSASELASAHEFMRNKSRAY